MTDALQQRSRYQCALKNLKNASLAWGIPSIYSVQNYVDCSSPLFTIGSTRKDVSMVTVA